MPAKTLDGVAFAEQAEGPFPGLYVGEIQLLGELVGGVPGVHELGAHARDLVFPREEGVGRPQGGGRGRGLEMRGTYRDPASFNLEFARVLQTFA
ncbi:MAG: hypothetical protein ABW000_11155 [Actinoplanes sp.]